MNFEEIISKFKEREENLYKREFKIHPVHTNRASALGHPCLRYLVFLRTRWQDQLPPDVYKLRLLERGKNEEKIIIQKLLAMGYDVVEVSRSFYDKDFNISGIIDAKIRGFEIEKAVPAEIKALSDYHFNKLNTPNDFKTAKEHYLRGYYTQIQIYLFLSSQDRQKFEDFGLFILQNKQTGELKIIPVQIDLDEVENALKKAEAVENHLKNNTVPQKIDDLSICAKCEFRHICLPELEAQGWDYEISEDVLEIVKKIYELKKELEKYDQIHAEYEVYKSTLKEMLQNKIEQNTEILAGDYLIKVKKITTKRIDTKSLPPEIKQQYEKETVSYRIDIVNLKED